MFITFLYTCTEGGIEFDDTDIEIEWPMEGIKEVILSEKDGNRKKLSEILDS